MKVLITGAGGFVGGHLARVCREHGAEVIGWVRKHPSHDPLKPILQKSQMEAVDLLDAAAVQEGLAKVRDRKSVV